MCLFVWNGRKFRQQFWWVGHSSETKLSPLSLSLSLSLSTRFRVFVSFAVVDSLFFSPSIVVGHHKKKYPHLRIRRRQQPAHRYPPPNLLTDVCALFCVFSAATCLLVEGGTCKFQPTYLPFQGTRPVSATTASTLECFSTRSERRGRGQVGNNERFTRRS